MYCSLNDSVLMTDPRWHLPWSMILIPWSVKSFCADCIKLLSFIMRMVFAGFGQYPKSRPLAFRYSNIFHACQWSDCRAIVRIPYLFHLIICNLSAHINGLVVRHTFTLPLLHCPLVSHLPVTVCGSYFPVIAWWVCYSCCVGMCTWGTQSFDVF